MPESNPIPDGQEPSNPSGWTTPWFMLFLGAVGVSLMITFWLNQRQTAPQPISWNVISVMLQTPHRIDSLVVVNGTYVDIYLPDSPASRSDSRVTGISRHPAFVMPIASVESFERRLDEAQRSIPPEQRVAVSYQQPNPFWWQVLSWLIPLGLLFVLWQWILKRSIQGPSGPGGGSTLFNFGKSTATLMDKEHTSTVTFAQVAGLEEAKVEIKEIVDFLKDPQAYTKLGAKIPKGVMIVGPPGTGKTLLAKAVAGEAQVPFFSISGSEFVEMFVGVGASRVRDLFRRAKEKAPCIVFIDEIDAVGRSRSRQTLFSGANDERESTLNQLLTEMDGFSSNSGVMVLAATNRADMLDPALLRPGRFDRHIYLDLPSLLDREAIFEVHLKPLVKDDSVRAKALAARTPGFSGADIANVCNEAALMAARRKSQHITDADFSEAMDRIVAGLEHKSRILNARERTMVAYHEAGHALVGWFLPHVDPLMKVSIIPRGRALGAAWYLPEERQLKTSGELFEDLCVAMGGRAAEELRFAEVSSGALDDLEKASKEAYRMVAYYGFDAKLGKVSFYDSRDSGEGSWQKPYSEATAELIDQAVRMLLEQAYSRALTSLKTHREALDHLADALLHHEVLDQEDLIQLLGPRDPFPAVASRSMVAIQAQ